MGGVDSDGCISESIKSLSTIANASKILDLTKSKKLMLAKSKKSDLTKAKKSDFAKANSFKTDFFTFKAKKTFIYL